MQCTALPPLPRTVVTVNHSLPSGAVVIELACYARDEKQTARDIGCTGVPDLVLPKPRREPDVVVARGARRDALRPVRDSWQRILNKERNRRLTSCTNCTTRRTWRTGRVVTGGSKGKAHEKYPGGNDSAASQPGST
jgi:hypothetical protein